MAGNQEHKCKLKLTITCPLCPTHNNRKKLCRSHIIPEFLYKRGYDEKHRLKKRLKGLGGGRIVQQGFKDYLLCEDCEQFLNRSYEKPIERIWDQIIPDKPSNNVLVLKNIDFNILKLFHLSILWRASVCKHDDFSHVRLGAKHESQIKDILWANTRVSSKQYPIRGKIITFPKTGETMKGFVTSFVPKKAKGHPCYPFFYGGCAWWILVSSHSVGNLDENFIGFNSDLRLEVEDYQDSVLISPVMSELVV